MSELKQLLHSVGRSPSILIIGGFGRCGSGAEYIIRELGLDARLWGRSDVQSKRISQKILTYDIMLNCILVDSTTTSFLSKEDFIHNEKLSVIGDISCEPDHVCNPLPFYSQASTFENPAHRIWEKGKAVDLISIDNLPTFLPMESSAHFSEQLMPHLDSLLSKGLDSAIWRRADEKFNEVINDYFPVIMRNTV